MAAMATEGAATRVSTLLNADDATEALANTLIGVVMIALALLGAVAELAGVPAAVGTILALSLVGIAATRWTPEPEQMTKV